MALVLSSVVPTLVLAFVLLMVDLSTATKLVVVGTIAGALVGGWIIWGLGRVVASMGTLMGRDSALTGFEHRQDEVGTLMASYNKLLATVEQQATEINTFATRLSSAYEELESTNALLKESVFKDEVTGFYNRRFLLLRLDEEVSRWRRFRLPVSVVLLEVEELREVADASGYAAYEEALAAFAGVLAELSHGINVLARYDGSRFAALLVETPRQEALRFVDRARDAVTTGFSHAAEITLRIGIASLPDDAMLADELLSVADTSLRRGTEA